MFKNILIPLDGSPLAENALPFASKLADFFESKLTLLRSVESKLKMVPAGSPYELAYKDEVFEQKWAEADNYLEDVRKRYELQASQSVIMRGKPASEILDVVAAKAIDLIVMTTHGHRGLTRMMLGSVTERVLRHATCPILVVKEDVTVRNILVPLDGSDLSATVLAPTIALAEAVSAEITLFHVAEPLPRESEIDDGIYLNSVQTYLESVKQTLPASVPIKVLAQIGNPAERILEVSEGDGFDLVAMSTHGESGIERWVYGSVVEKVMRSSQKAFLLVRPEFS